MFLLIDGNNLAWAGFYALERAMKPEDDERRHRVAMLGLAGMVLGAIARCGEPPGKEPPEPLTRVAICFDMGRPVRRRELYPNYQMDREYDPKFVQNEPTILRAIDEFAAAMHCAPVDVLRGENTEADDLIAGLVQAEPKAVKRIVSTDRDFLQLVGPKTSVYAPVKKAIIDQSNFFEMAAPRTSSGAIVTFPQERFLDYRALTGDPSDSVPGVPGVGPLSAAKLLAVAPLDSFFGKPAAVRTALGRKSDAVERAFADGTAERVVSRNRELMDLRLPSPVWPRIGEMTSRGRWDRPTFERWYDEQRISAVVKEELIRRLEHIASLQEAAR